MLGKLNRKRAQTTAEYAVLLGLVIAAVIGMQTYVKRGWQARLKVETDQMSTSFFNNTRWSNISEVNPTESIHYEPTKLERQTHEETTGDTETTQIKTGGMTEKTFNRTTQQRAGDYQKYKY